MEFSERIGISGSQCGICCNKDYPCENCLVATLKSNGIPVGDIEKFRGKRHVNRSSFEPWGCSELCFAIEDYLQSWRTNNSLKATSKAARIGAGGDQSEPPPFEAP